MRSQAWTPANRAVLAEAIAQGCKVASACRRAGVSQNTYNRWLRHGRALLTQETNGHALAPDELVYVTFVQWIELAVARSRTASR